MFKSPLLRQQPLNYVSYAVVLFLALILKSGLKLYKTCHVHTTHFIKFVCKIILLVHKKREIHFAPLSSVYLYSRFKSLANWSLRENFVSTFSDKLDILVMVDVVSDLTDPSTFFDIITPY